MDLTAGLVMEDVVAPSLGSNLRSITELIKFMRYPQLPVSIASLALKKTFPCSCDLSKKQRMLNDTYASTRRRMCMGQHVQLQVKILHPKP